MKVTAEVKGLKELEQQLIGLQDAVAAQKVLQSALTTASTPMLQAAKDKAPIASEPYLRTVGAGDTKKTKIYQPGYIATRIRRRKLVEQGDSAGLLITVGKSAWWAKFFEHGGPKNVKHPFMLPAFDEQAQSLLDSFGAILQKRINALLKKRKKQ